MLTSVSSFCCSFCCFCVVSYPAMFKTPGFFLPFLFCSLAFYGRVMCCCYVLLLPVVNSVWFGPVALSAVVMLLPAVNSVWLGSVARSGVSVCCMRRPINFLIYQLLTVRSSFPRELLTFPEPLPGQARNLQAISGDPPDIPTRAEAYPGRLLSGYHALPRRP